jgi:hypothetical protein
MPTGVALRRSVPFLGLNRVDRPSNSDVTNVLNALCSGTQTQCMSRFMYQSPPGGRIEGEI